MTYAIFLSLAIAQAAPIVEVPAAITAKTGFVTITATGSAASVRWVLLDPGPSMVDPGLVKDSHTCLLHCPKPGIYRVAAYAGKGDDAALGICTVTIFDETPPPPPGPAPVPPGPAPANLRAKLQAAFTADPAAAKTKAAQVIALSGLYEAMAMHASSPQIKTLGDLLADLKSTAGQMILPSALVELRRVLAAEVSAALGVDVTQQMTDPLRATAGDVFTRISKALEGVK